MCVYERLERRPLRTLRHHHVVADFRCVEVGGTLRPGGDVTEAHFVGFDEALTLPCTEGLLPLLARVLGQRAAARGRTRPLAHGAVGGHRVPVA